MPSLEMMERINEMADLVSSLVWQSFTEVKWHQLARSYLKSFIITVYIDHKCTYIIFTQVGALQWGAMQIKI